jgi:hypothetical protein
MDGEAGNGVTDIELEVELDLDLDLVVNKAGG